MVRYKSQRKKREINEDLESHTVSSKAPEPAALSQSAPGSVPPTPVPNGPANPPETAEKPKPEEPKPKKKTPTMAKASRLMQRSLPGKMQADALVTRCTEEVKKLIPDYVVQQFYAAKFKADDMHRQIEDIVGQKKPLTLLPEVTHLGGRPAHRGHGSS